MLPTISVDDHVKITKHFDKLDYGDIVVFKFDGKIELYKGMNDLRKSSGLVEHYDELHGYFIFRIVGLPGDSIAINKDTCIINGKKNPLLRIKKGTSNKDVKEIYRQYVREYIESLPNGINIRIFLYVPGFSVNRDLEVSKIPENHYFLMGDFRGEALDSRNFGPIPKEQIVGKVIKITPKKK